MNTSLAQAAKTAWQHVLLIIYGWPFIPQRLWKVGFLKRNLQDEQAQNLRASGVELAKTLSWFDFASIGSTTMMAAGAFTLAGYYYSRTGPQVILTFLLAGITAVLAACCYLEFTVELPVAGGGFAFCMFVFGEIIGWLVGAGLYYEYLLTAAANSRIFTVYFSQLINHPGVFGPHYSGSITVDYIAFILVLIMTAVAVFPVKATRVGFKCMQLLYVILCVVVLIAAFSQADTSNWTHACSPRQKPEICNPATPNGFVPISELANLVVVAAAMVFFLFVGFDAVASGAEEARSPSSVPVGIFAAMAFTTVFYMLLVSALIMLVPYGVLRTGANNLARQFGVPISTDIPPVIPRGARINLPYYAFAFSSAGLNWASYIVSLTACIGVVLSLSVSIFAASRLLTSVCRERLLPSRGGRVWKKTHTPVWAILISGFISSLMALLLEFRKAFQLVSVASLTVFTMVALAVLIRRYTPDFYDPVEKGGRSAGRPLFGHLLSKGNQFVVLLGSIISTFALVIAFDIAWRQDPTSLRSNLLAIFAALYVVPGIIIKLFVPIDYVPPHWGIPNWAMPWLPMVSIWADVFLLCNLEHLAFTTYFIMLGGALVLYLLYGLHGSYNRFFDTDGVRRPYQEADVYAEDGKVSNQMMGEIALMPRSDEHSSNVPL